jgi:hypothetical protein
VGKLLAGFFGLALLLIGVYSLRIAWQGIAALLGRRKLVKIIYVGNIPRRKNGALFINCPNASCGEELELSPENAGKIGRCPHCGQDVHTPELLVGT